ncbi:accessory Sec system protein Asp2, partial [Staphylococcus epidermidis NIHLM057]
VKAKGTGVVHLRAIHKRWSRAEMGQFIMGGQRYNDENGEEFIHYFNPGDLKPPLNVYFSGYRSAEGFEGYFMMNSLEAPFLLIGDPRIEGGSFYLGSETYENNIKKIIKEALEYLNFKEDDLILSGLSMGSFGALYYGSQLTPRAVIVGKPLVNIGRIAENMKLKRPNDFGTALDILMSQAGTFSKQNINHLNKRFWEKFKQNEVENTTFAIAYMQNDDYDDIAFDDLMSLLGESRTHVMTRGVPGRHNDDSATITSWFVNFYHIILNNQFGRE